PHFCKFASCYFLILLLPYLRHYAALNPPPLANAAQNAPQPAFDTVERLVYMNVRDLALHCPVDAARQPITHQTVGQLTRFTFDGIPSLEHLVDRWKRAYHPDMEDLNRIMQDDDPFPHLITGVMTRIDWTVRGKYYLPPMRRPQNQAEGPVRHSSV